MHSLVYKWTQFVILIGMRIHSARSQITTDDLWESCDTTVCGTRDLTIQCEKGSKILIGNVTSGLGQAYDSVGYANLRRMCMGMNRCNATGQGFCNLHRGTQFKVSYICVPEAIIDNNCVSTGIVLSDKAGFITSPNYPAQTQFRKCKWKITVPDDHYVHVYLNEVLYSVPEVKQCDEGLRFSAINTCGMKFPTYHICHETQMRTTISACSDLEILLPSDSQDMRFWLSYAVVKVPSLKQVSMYDTAITCNVETKAEFTYIMSPAVETGGIGNDTNNSGNITLHPSKTGDGDNDGVDYVMIIGFAVGIFVIIAIIVVAMIYLRCRYLINFQEKRDSKINMSNSNSQTNCSEIQKRPLPDTVCDTANGEDQLVLQQSYSEVKDRIPITSPPTENVISPTYVEIEEFEPSKTKPKHVVVAKRSIDNSKRELPAKPQEEAHSSTYSEIEVDDAKDVESEKALNAKNKKNKEKVFPNYFYKKKMSNASNIYAECEDVSKVDKDKPYMDMSHKKAEESAYVPHSKDSKDKVNQSKKCEVGDKVDKTKTSSIPYADSDVTKKGIGQTDATKTASKARKDSLSSESDSDICMVENELYEPFETAKV